MKQEQFPAFPAMVRDVAALKHSPKHLNGLVRFVDMFCGIGGFHQAATSFGMKCVFACDVDEEARRAYEHNYGLRPKSDIARIPADSIPDHDIFFAGFPCQPFSIIGQRKGFDDIRGTLFFEIVRVLEAKRPRALLLENVKQLTTNNKGQTIARIVDALVGLGYHVNWKVLNALDFGLPHKRERVFIAGTLDPLDDFPWPVGGRPRLALKDVLEKKPDAKYYVSERIRKRRQKMHTSQHKPGIWHENKAGNIASHPFSCALRAGASHNYLLVNGERRLTSREMLRLQGFPDSFEIVCTDSQTRKQAGNAVPVPLVAAGIEGILRATKATKTARTKKNAS